MPSVAAIAAMSTPPIRRKRHARIFHVSLGLAVILAGTTIALAVYGKKDPDQTNVLPQPHVSVTVSGTGHTVVTQSPSAHIEKQ